MNPKGFVYRRFAVPAGSTVVAPVINGIAQISDSKQRIVATGRTVRPSEIKSYFDFEHKSFYYEIQGNHLISVSIAAGRRWQISH
jgi:hypothetical protein